MAGSAAASGLRATVLFYPTPPRDSQRVIVGVEFPPSSAEWTFFLAAFVILVGPLLAERLRLPGSVGVILGGLLVGPSVLGLIEREGIVASLGELGLLVLMFLAGLELDLDEFQADRRAALAFGALTFAIPFALGLLLVLALEYGLATALLYGSLWASHTLVSYPIVQEHGLLRERAVGIASGGTVITDTLALTVLAIVAGSVASDARPAIVLLEVGLGLAVLGGLCALVLPRVARWVFAGVGQHRGARFLFVLAALTSAALVADRAGIEGIVGAFFAGLALNRLVPARSRLMEQIEFVGGVVLVPFFLLATGMLIDPSRFADARVLAIAGLSLAVVFVGKTIAGLLAGRLLGLARPQVRLLLGLSLAQAAATLAAVTIGVDLGLFDADLLNAALVVVLVTVLVSSIITRGAARRIEPPSMRGERLAETVLVPVQADEDLRLVQLASRLAMGKGGTVLVGAVAVGPGAPLDAARSRARDAERAASSLGAEVSSAVRVSPSVATALAAIAAEQQATLVVIGWQHAAAGARVVLGGEEADLVALAEVPVLAVLGARGDYRRVVLALDHRDLSDLRRAERELAIAVASVAVAGVGGRALLITPVAEPAREIARRLGEDAEVVVDDRGLRDAVETVARQDDLVIVPSQPGAMPLRRDALALADRSLGCTVAVPARARATVTLVTDTPMLVAGRRV